MPSLSGDAALRGISKAALDALLHELGPGSIPAAARYDALARFEELPYRHAVRPGRDWKQDLAKLDFAELSIALEDQPQSYATPDSAERFRTGRGIVDSFDVARVKYPELFAAAFGRALDTRGDKFASLALAFQRGGTFVHVPAGTAIDEPLVLCSQTSEAAARFPYVLISLGEGARATVIDRRLAAGSGGFLDGLVELLLGAKSELTYVSCSDVAKAPTGVMYGYQQPADEQPLGTSRIIVTRAALLASDATLHVDLAETSGTLVVSRNRLVAGASGASVELAALFFADERQHVDLSADIVHAAPHTRSQTLVRSAGTGHGQGRFYGNIRIEPHAHGADATLRDDVLLLSKGAHVDSVPALEISANDVKAFHGATVGAISDEELFYAQSRGIARPDAERMIALGFFEPAVGRFPDEALREQIRASLANKLSPGRSSTT